MFLKFLEPFLAIDDISNENASIDYQDCIDEFNFKLRGDDNSLETVQQIGLQSLFVDETKSPVELGQQFNQQVKTVGFLRIYFIRILIIFSG